MNDLEQIITRLAELGRMLDKATHEIAEWDERTVRAKAANETAYARAFLTNDGTVDQRRQKSLLDTREQRFTHEMNEMAHRACRERIRTLTIQIEIQRSIASARKAQWSAEPVGQL